MKVAVIGYSGAGKSTLARELGRRLGCPVLHLDTVQFTPGWQERDRDEARAMVKAFMERPDWVIDGNYHAFCHEQRMRDADAILFLNFPRLVCFWQALKRYHQYKGRTRVSMAAGCSEKFDGEFIRWILWEGRTKSRRKSYREILRRYPQKAIVCRSRRAVRRYLRDMKIKK